VQAIDNEDVLIDGKRKKKAEILFRDLFSETIMGRVLDVKSYQSYYYADAAMCCDIGSSTPRDKVHVVFGHSRASIQPISIERPLKTWIGGRRGSECGQCF
jgi:hypothetical protein